MASKKEKLTIHKLIFNLSFDSEDDYNLYAKKISKLVNTRLPEKLDKILSQHNIPEGRIIIRKLEINMHEIDPSRFERQITNSIAREINAILGKYIEEIQREIRYAKFRFSRGERFTIQNSLYSFESEIFIEKSVDLEKAKKELPQVSIDLDKKISALYTEPESMIETPTTISISKEKEKGPDKKVAHQIDVDGYIEGHIVPKEKREILKPDDVKPEIDRERTVPEEKKEKKEIDLARTETKATSVIQIEEKPRLVTELDEVLMYYLKYGRLPSNIKYELGTSLLDVLKINIKDAEYYEVLRKYVHRDAKARERLYRLSEKSITDTLVQKQIISKAEMADFDLTIPRSYIDYLIAVIHQLDMSTFSSLVMKYNLNDIIRFIYADSPQKLRSVIRFVLLDYPSDKSVEQKIKYLFSLIGKGTVNKIISAFIRKGGVINRYLNELNLINVRDEKEAHAILLQAILEQKDVLKTLISKDFKLSQKDIRITLIPQIYKRSISELLKEYPETLEFILSKTGLKEIEELSLARVYKKLSSESLVLQEQELDLLVFILMYVKDIKDGIEKIPSIVPTDRSILADLVQHLVQLRKYLIDPDVRKEYMRILQSAILPEKQKREDFIKTYLPKPKEDEIPEITERRFISEDPTFEHVEISREDLIDYFFTHGSLPYSISRKERRIDELSIDILIQEDYTITRLPYFRDKLYKRRFRYEEIGKLSIEAIEKLVAALAPGKVSQLITLYQNFRTNIHGGIPEIFQKAFLLYYALIEQPKSYLEEMIFFWKDQFGDADKVILNKWRLSEEYEIELRNYLIITEKKLEEQLKVEYEFQSHAKDISVKNAGLVILWPFLKVYFKLLDLLNDKGEFISVKEKERACHLLQFLAVKRSEGEEFYYPLNKVLTGYPLEEPLSEGIVMTQKEIDVSVALLKNVVRQWNALKNASVDALRGSFLIRDGILTPSTNGWKLTVEKKAYDILLDKLPWGIGMIKLSWIPYVISVEWETKIM